MNEKPQDQNVKQFPPWANWLLAALLALALIQLLHERFGTGDSTPAPEQTTNAAPAAISARHAAQPPPVASNTTVPVKFISRRAGSGAEDDINSAAIVSENTNWVSVINTDVTSSIADVYASTKPPTNSQQAVSVTPRQRRLVEIARKTFTRKNDPAYSNDMDLTKVANAVAGFNVHYPSWSDCKCLVDICKQLEAGNKYTGPTGDAIEGSRYIFENEIKMTDRGFYRYGRTWVDAKGLARINAAVAEREKKIADDLAKQRQEQARVAAKAAADRKAPVAAPPVPKPGLRGPNRPIKRIGEN